MSVLETFLLFVGTLVAIVLIALVFHQLGYKKGREDGYHAGYDLGRKHADNWWLGIEEQANQARQNIRREQAQP